MVRYCHVMTLACATMLAAGASADTAKVVGSKAELASVTATEQVSFPRTAKSYLGVAQLDNAGIFAGQNCRGLWDNGTFDGADAQMSHLGGIPTLGTKVADDFYLCEGSVYDLNSIQATVLTSTFLGLVKIKAEIYEDCNGKPGRLLYTLDGVSTETGNNYPHPAPDGRPLRIVNANFAVDPTQSKAESRNIVLKGGAYWISVYGITDGLSSMQMFDSTFWGTAGAGVIKGAVPCKIDGTPTNIPGQYNFSSSQWEAVNECCIGCTDFNFNINASVCKILVDNGEGRRQVASEAVGSTSQFRIGSFSTIETRSADDFVVPPCSDYRLCYVEACVLTNCIGFTGQFEIYNNDCNTPAWGFNDSPVFRQTGATKIIDLGYTVRMEGRTLKAYKLEFHDLNFVLAGGRQYWISVGVRHTFSANEKAFFCYNSDCARSCLIRWNDGRVLTSTSIDFRDADGIRKGWAKTGNDHAFLLAANPIETAVGGSTTSCVADFNSDASVDTRDIFDFLGAWFAGCP